ncbi:MAG: hypothetical protein NDI84_07700 [Steroidobacteraceae bacterium]|nr:hypothetical protein [Steroidobacteraceae bacterium]
MSADDWFRNKTWNDEIAALFEQRLKRSRKADQHLRIQADALAESYPQVAIALLDRFFALPDPFAKVWGYCVRARALCALGRVDDAIDAYEAALREETSHPSVLSDAYIDLAELVVRTSRIELYERAAQVLAMRSDRPAFPVQKFRYNAIRALLCRYFGHHDDARFYARSALEAASVLHSGFRYHAGLGLVGDKYADLLAQLKNLTDA